MKKMKTVMELELVQPTILTFSTRTLENPDRD
jgi:hypothetical protein